MSEHGVGSSPTGHAKSSRACATAIRLSPRPAIVRHGIMKRQPSTITSRVTCGPGSPRRVGERRVLELIAKYGLSTFLTALSSSRTMASRCRFAHSKLPKAVMSSPGARRQHSLHRDRRDRGHEFVIDLSDNPGGTGWQHASRDGSMVAVQMVFITYHFRTGARMPGHFHPALVRDQFRIRRESAGGIRDSASRVRCTT